MVENTAKFLQSEWRLQWHTKHSGISTDELPDEEKP